MKQSSDALEIEHHLQELDDRARALRARQRIMRKQLARESGAT